jgi:hypothetical protein
MVRATVAIFTRELLGTLTMAHSRSTNHQLVIPFQSNKLEIGCSTAPTYVINPTLIQIW